MQRTSAIGHLNGVKRRIGMLFLCMCFGRALAWDALSLEDCVKMVRERSLDVESAKLSERASEASLLSSQASGRPTLSAHINQSLYDTPFDGMSQDHYRLNVGLSGSYKIWDGGQTSASVESRQLLLKASRYNTELAVLNVQERVMNSFVNLLAAKESRIIADSALVLSDSLVALNERLLEAGTITRSDLALVKSDAAQAKVKQISSAQAERTALTDLRQLLELYRTDSLNLEAPQTEYEKPEDMGAIPSFANVMAEVKKNHPGLTSDSLQVQAASKEEEIAHSNNSISVTLGAEASSGFQAWKSDRYARQAKNGYTHSISLGINIPIIDGGTTSAKVLSAQVETERARVAQRETEKSLEDSMEQLYLQAENADASWNAALANLESAQESYAVAVEQRNVGLITFTDFLEQKNNLLNAKSTLIQAKYTSVLARNLLELYMGKFQ